MIKGKKRNTEGKVLYKDRYKQLGLFSTEGRQASRRQYYKCIKAISEEIHKICLSDFVLCKVFPSFLFEIATPSSTTLLPLFLSFFFSIAFTTTYYDTHLCPLSRITSNVNTSPLRAETWSVLFTTIPSTAVHCLAHTVSANICSLNKWMNTKSENELVSLNWF